MAALDLPQPKNLRYADARNAVFTEAVLAANTGRAVSYSRRKQHYVGQQRYHGRSYGFSTVLAAVCDGVATGLLEEERARPGSRGRQSCFRATSRLTHSLKIPAPEHRPSPEMIWLRDCDGHLIDYQDCPLTLCLRREVAMINRDLGNITIAFNGADVRNEGGCWIVGETHCLSVPPRLRRVFSRASFDMGGRHTALGNLFRRATAR